MRLITRVRFSNPSPAVYRWTFRGERCLAAGRRGSSSRWIACRRTISDLHVQVTFLGIHIGAVRSSALTMRPIVQRIFPGAADRGPLIISAKLSLDLHRVPCLTTLYVRLNIPVVVVVVAGWLAGWQT